MPIRVAAATPLRVGWPHPLCPITRGIRVIEKPTFKEDNWGFWNLRRTELTDVLERSHWLCVEEECEWQDRDELLGRLSGKLRTAMLGFQLWCVKGWDGLIICAIVRDNGDITVESVEFVEPYPMSQWSKMTDIDKLAVAQLAPLVEGTFAVYESGVVRAINPFHFLEIGLQTAYNHVVAGALLWMMGLDGLLAAEKQVWFASRLKRLLGEATPVFPPDWIGRRPVYTVADVAANMYDLRNLIAHGKEVLEKYRKPIDFQFEPPELAYLAVEKWNYATLLFESSLFTLIAALRTVITAGMLQMIADKRAWEAWLDDSGEGRRVET
ncbi:MAG: hypothetical protein AAB225_21770 [Acidobacteriota bacterium]